MASTRSGLERQVIVAKSGGDYTSIQAAVDYAASRASAARPWTVLVAPGVYNLTQTLQLRTHVRLVGSGRYATRLTAAISGQTRHAATAMVAGMNDASIASLSLENNSASGRHAIGIFNLGTSIEVRDIDLVVSADDPGSSADAYGILNDSSSSLIEDVTVRVTAKSTAYGIYNSSASNVGNTEQPTVMRHIDVDGQGARGYGLYLNLYSNDQVFNSKLQGNEEAMTILSSSGNARIYDTEIIGQQRSPAGTQCINTFDAGLLPVSC